MYLVVWIPSTAPETAKQPGREVHIMQQAARDVRALVLRSLQQLDPYRDEYWDQQIQELCRTLLRLESSADISSLEDIQRAL
jgi:hypothetical protein